MFMVIQGHWRSTRKIRRNNMKPKKSHNICSMITVPTFSIIRPHRSTTYVDTAYCYRSVSRSVCRTSDPAKMAAPIKMLFELRTRVGPGNHVLDGGPDPPMGRDNFARGRGIGNLWYLLWAPCINHLTYPTVKYRDTLQSPARKRLNRSRCRLGCGLGWAVGIMH